jgi:type IV pilus assembly protein PilN
MIRINLVAEKKPTKGPKAPSMPSAPGAVQAYLFLVLFGGGAAVLCAAGYWYKSSQIRELDSQIATAEKRQKELQAIKAQVDALEAKRNTFQQKVDLIERLKSEQGGPVHMLDEISKALPDFVWLTAMDQTGGGIKFTGESNSLTSVADFISGLQRSGWFPAVDLTTSVQATNSTLINFTLQAQFKNPEQAAREKAAAAKAAANPSPSPSASAKPGQRR